MKFSILATILATASVAQAAITWSIEKDVNPTADQLDAYTRIEAAMTAAAARHARLGTAMNVVRAVYTPAVPTAEAYLTGTIRFGANRQFMTERTALHEIAHTLGVGLTAPFDSKCASGNWTTALPLMRSFEGPDAKIYCGGQHFWPYGLNYESEMTEETADRHVLMINAMLADGMAS
ncbi:ricin B lectin [Colletotrichum falcatum]|nr:ricin B lectin [Colletotrichum falcatum]